MEYHKIRTRRSEGETDGFFHHLIKWCSYPIPKTSNSEIVDRTELSVLSKVSILLFSNVNIISNTISLFDKVNPISTVVISYLSV